MQEGERRYTAFTKANLTALQVLQNKVLRLQTGLGYDTPVSELLATSGMLSVNQLVAYTTLVTVYKVLLSGEPRYLAERLYSGQRGQHGARQETRQNLDINVHFNLGVAREGFLYRGGKLWNMLPPALKLQTNTVSVFKKLVKMWIKENVPALP